MYEPADGEREEDDLVDEPPAAVGEGLIEDSVVVQEDQGVLEGVHDVLDLAVGGVCPLLGLAALDLSCAARFLWLRPAAFFLKEQVSSTHDEDSCAADRQPAWADGTKPKDSDKTVNPSKGDQCEEQSGTCAFDRM